MKKFLSKYAPGASFFLLFYFILHEFNANYGLIQPGLAVRLFFKYIIIIIIIFGLSFLFFRGLTKASFYTVVTTAIYVFFGALHDSVKAIASESFIASYKFILPLLAIFLAVAAWLIKKKPSLSIKTLPFIILVTFILSIWEVIHLGYNIISQKNLANNFAVNKIPSIVLTNDSLTKPDIFYIVLDEYTSSATLAEEFDFSNNDIDSFLARKGFYIAKKAVSNYPHTFLSIGSTLNLHYLEDKFSGRFMKPIEQLQGVHTVYKSKLPLMLESIGYCIFNYSVFDLEGKNIEAPPYFARSFEGAIEDQTLVGRFKRNVLWNFKLKKLGFGKRQIPKSVLKQRDDHIQNYIHNNINQLKIIAAKNDICPRFVYCHLMIPHEPFYLKRDGKLVDNPFASDINIKNNTWNN